MDSRPRSLSLTPISFAIIIALGHGTAGHRLGPLATVVGSPRSSVQRSLGSLVASGLVVGLGRRPVRYRLTDHPAREAVLEAALLLSDPGEATSLTLRASPAVGYAAALRRGYVVVLAPEADPAVIDRLHRSLALLSDARVRAPKVRIAGLNELVRLQPGRSRAGVRSSQPKDHVVAMATTFKAATPMVVVRPKRRTSSG